MTRNKHANMLPINYKDKQVRICSDTNYYAEISIIFCSAKYAHRSTALANIGERT